MFAPEEEFELARLNAKKAKSHLQSSLGVTRNGREMAEGGRGCVELGRSQDGPALGQTHLPKVQPFHIPLLLLHSRPFWSQSLGRKRGYGLVAEGVFGWRGAEGGRDAPVLASTQC